MAVAFIDKTQVIGAGTSPTGTEPTGTTQGDVLIALYLVDGAASEYATMPSGWTSLQSGAGITHQFRYVLAYTVRGASAPSFAFTQSTSTYRELHILSFSGVDTSYPIDDFMCVPSTNAASNNPNAPSATAATSSSMALAIGITWAGASAGYGAPSGYTIRTNNGANENGVIATKLLSAAGAEDPAAFTGTSATVSNNWAATLLLRPSGNGAITTSPRLVSEYESAFNIITTPKTVPVTVDSTADLLVVCGMTGDNTTTINTPTGGSGVTWTLQQSDVSTSYCAIYIWTATNITPQTFTLTVASNDNNAFGFNVLKFKEATVGASNKAQNASGTPSVNLTTTRANSAIIVMNGDWVPVDGASRTWLTNAGSLSEQTYAYYAGGYTSYIGYHPNAGPVGTYAVGLSAPSAQKYNIIALEIKGTDPTLVAWLTA